VKDMFGNELTETEARDLLKRKTPIPRGHYFTPGTGPAGETCGTCKHRVLRGNSEGRGRGHQKCGLNRANWTHGPRSDIRAKDPACKFWEREEPE
jgi:hypothetical protein